MEKYLTDGYKVVEIKQLIPEIDLLKKDIYSIFNVVSKQFDGEEIKDDFGIMQFYKKIKNYSINV